MKKRVIAFFTGNRAEYGLQKPIIEQIQNFPNLEYRLIVSGAHLENHFGNTLELIKKDGISVHATPRIDLTNDDLASTALAIGNGITALVETFKNLKPDIVVVYADRFEGFAAVVAASQMRIPVAHIEGGDLTEGGALDDSIRHAMTKLSHLHFSTNEEAKNRILALGEEPWRVFNAGLPAIDTIKQGKFATEQELKDKLNLNLSKPTIVFTQHSVTNQFEQAIEQLEPSLQALEKIAAEGTNIIITYPNNDAGGRVIVDRLNQLAKKQIPNILVTPTLGSYNFYGLLSLRQKGFKVACAGNSSSGIKETPIFGVPTVNIGTRQLGRLKANNVIDSDYNTDQIYKSLTTCLHDEKFISQALKAQNPYGDGRSGEIICKVLSEVEIGPKLILKKMTI